MHCEGERGWKLLFPAIVDTVRLMQLRLVAFCYIAKVPPYSLSKAIT